MQKIKKEFDLNGRKAVFEFGTYASRADVSIMASMGDTVVLVTITTSKEDASQDYFPLNVEYIERLYAGGIISASRFVKRERFPSVEATLTARMIDRSIRPLFPSNFRKEVQVIVTVLSFDGENDPVILSLDAVSCALHLSKIPFYGPIAGIRLGYKDNDFIINPTSTQLAESEMNFVVAGTKDRILMLDAGAKEVSEDLISQAFDLSCKNFAEIIDFQDELKKELGAKKYEEDKALVDEKLIENIEAKYKDKIKQEIYKRDSETKEEEKDSLLNQIIEEFASTKEAKYSESDVINAFDKISKKIVRAGILQDKVRPSGRKLDEIREIDIKTSLLPRTHGSALFTRGVTQSLSVVTLGSTRLEQTLESFEGEETKRFMHHYNGANFSLGEAGRYAYYPGRREVGHGALAEKALEPVIPSQEEFPYTIRVVSEILSQQGSSSMAATTASSLALMDAGVPIKTPVAGIAIGLVTSDDEKEYVLLTDVQDIEDFYGDMDFKVAGTKNGITAIQMDNKLKGIKVDILKEALKVARSGREFVLEKVTKVLAKPKKELSKYAPKISTVKINPLKIADVIGPGGKIIRKIIEDTGVEIDIDDDGQVHIAATDEKARQEAVDRINAIVEEPEVGKTYDAVVASIKPYGVFVDVSKNITGLVHKSELSDSFVSDPSKVVNEGDKVRVKIIGIDGEGRINFSVKKADK